MKILQYARVSKEEQDRGDNASIEEQLELQTRLAEQRGWTVIGVYVDRDNYKATQNPKKGKVVNPSGERADRPGLLAMLERIRSGEPDAILCWRDDRLVRHPRVAVALLDALDMGRAQRRGQEIQMLDATGATIDPDYLSIMSNFWKKENARRAERADLGRVQTLKSGRWPGHYDRLGYTTIRELDKRGREIVLVEKEAETVKLIFDLFEANHSLLQLARKLTWRGIEQKGRSTRKDDWRTAILHQILTAEDYTGQATWNFKDGRQMTISIPAIISQEQFKRVQKRIKSNKKSATRNAKGVYLLQGLVSCGECKSSLTVKRHYHYWGKLKDGTKKKYTYDIPQHEYVCIRRMTLPHNEQEHPMPYGFNGVNLDYAVWRYVVDKGVKHPELIQNQVLTRQAELQSQGESVTGDIGHARQKLADIDQERAFYQRQAARGKITEKEFDARMAETEDSQEYWQGELTRLQELRDQHDKVQAGLDYVTRLMENIQRKLPNIDQEPQELNAMPKDARERILKDRREIIRALCQQVKVYASGKVEILGLLDGSEVAQFESINPQSYLLKLTWAGWLNV